MSTEIDVIEKEKIKLTNDSLWKIIYHNDDVTSFEFVILSLIQIFKKSADEAIALSLLVHNQGKAVVAQYSCFDVADQKFLEITDFIRSFNSKLKVTMEQE